MRELGIKGLSPDKSPDRVGAGTGRRRGTQRYTGEGIFNYGTDPAVAGQRRNFIYFIIEKVYIWVKPVP